MSSLLDSCIASFALVGIKMNPGSVAKKVVKERDGTLSLHLENGQVDHLGITSNIVISW